MISSNVFIENGFEMRINFNLKDTSRVRGRKSQILLTTTINRKRVRLFTGLTIEARFWIKKSRNQVGEMAREDSSLGRVQLEYNKNINKELRQILKYCKEYADEVNRIDLMNSNPLTHSKENFEEFIKNKLRGTEANIRKRPKCFIEDYIERKSRMTNRNTARRISKGTVYNHKNSLRRLMLFCEEERLSLVWELFNSRFGERFTAWLQDKGYAANTIASQFSTMKVWLSEAEANGIEVEKHYHKWITKSRDVESIYLTEEEIERIYRLDLNSEELRPQINPRQKIEITRDMFVVACLTGLRFGDWKDMSEVKVNDGYLRVHTRKTDKTVVIPLLPIVKEIYAKYGNKFPKVVDKSHTIEQIRQCARWADIDTPTSLSRVEGGKTVIKEGIKADFVMNHTARRSFATNSYLRGIDPISIMAITGHTTQSNFLKYIKLDSEEHARIVAQGFAQRPTKPVALQH